MAHMSVVSIFNIGIKLMTWLNIYKLTKVCKIEEFIKILKWWLQYVGIRINELLGRVNWARNCSWCCSYKKMIKFIAQQFVNEQFCRGINLPLRIKFTKKGESYSFWRFGDTQCWEVRSGSLSKVVLLGWHLMAQVVGLGCTGLNWTVGLGWHWTR